MSLATYQKNGSGRITMRWYYIVITQHGLCKVKTANYNKQRELTISNAINKTAYFISECKSIHADKYDYTETEYVSSKKKVTIICPQHGKFKQLPTAHKKGANCPSCASLVSREQDNTHTDILVNLYIIRCYDANETFYKIGITAKNVESRFKYKNQLPYEYTILNTYKDNIDIIHKLEQHLHSSYANVTCRPSKKFAGHTECFNHVDDYETIIDNFINQ